MLKKLWTVLAVYGVWFAVFSGAEEVASGKYWKVGLGLVLALVITSVLPSLIKPD